MGSDNKMDIQSNFLSSGGGSYINKKDKPLSQINKQETYSDMDDKSQLTLDKIQKINNKIENNYIK